MTKLPTLFLVLLTIALLPACEEEPLKLSRAHRKIVDSLVQERKIGLRAELDSLCDIRFQDELDQKVDSIYQERREEIRRKINANAIKE